MSDAIIELLSNEMIQKANKIHNIGEDNIFSILSVENKEIFHCRFLKYLIQKNWLSFTEEVLSKKEIGNLKACQCEYPCVAIENCPNSKRGRMDLYFETENYIVVIEVKWHAGEQPLQLLRYHQSLKKSNKEIILVFLTLDGRVAENVSCSEKNCNESCHRKLEKNEYVCCSFKKVSEWIDVLLRKPETDKYLLEEYNDVLKEEINRMYAEENLIKIIDKPELFDAAETIARSMESVKDNIRRVFFSVLKNQISRLNPSLCVQDVTTDRKKKYIILQDEKKEEVQDASAQYWIISEKGEIFRFGYSTNLYCGIGNIDEKWVYITPNWFETKNSEENGYVSENSPKEIKIDVKNLGKNGKQKENAIVKWYFHQEQREKEIENVVCNMLRYFGLIKS